MCLLGLAGGNLPTATETVFVECLRRLVVLGSFLTWRSRFTNLYIATPDSAPTSTHAHWHCSQVLGHEFCPKSRIHAHVAPHQMNCWSFFSILFARVACSLAIVGVAQANREATAKPSPCSYQAVTHTNLCTQLIPELHRTAR